ncbi:MAG: vWA domain-containing protein [Pirellulales bacterium]
MSSPRSQRDADLDAQLRSVSLPDGLLERLRHVGAREDQSLDAAVRDVPLPSGFLARLRQIGHRPRRKLRWQRLALAASLFLAAGLSYFGLLYGVMRPSLPGELPSRLADTPDPAREQAKPARDAATPEPLESGAGVNEIALEPAQNVPEAAISPEETFAESIDPSLMPGLFEPLGSPLPSNPISPATPPEWGVLGANTTLDELPRLRKVGDLIRRGIDVPHLGGIDAFVRRYGVHPFIDPAADAKLKASQVPLEVSTGSFDLAVRCLDDNRLPPPGEIRTEEFLAAVDYGFEPPAERALGIRTAAGPSHFGGKALQLLQVGVQARDLAATNRPPTHLTIAVDVSGSMEFEDHLEMARRAVRQLGDRLGPRDRVSLVAFRDRGEAIVENLGPAQAEQLTAAVQSLSARGWTNVGAALETACAVAGRAAGEPGSVRRVALVTDELGDLDANALRQIEAALQTTAKNGTTLDVIALGEDAGENPQLERLARAGSGRVLRARNTDQLRWNLLEMLTGRSQIVAAAARLTVRFNPENVAAYRLLGHEMTSVLGRAPAKMEADMRAGQTATALYEIQLKPGGGDDVAVAELEWQEPGTGNPQRATQRISRIQFAISFNAAPLPLQAAALAAETAEILRGSCFARMHGASLAQVAALAREANPQLLDRPSFVQLVSLVEKADRAKLRRGRAVTPR